MDEEPESDSIEAKGEDASEPEGEVTEEMIQKILKEDAELLRRLADK